MNEEVEISLLSDEVSVETPLVADYILPTASSSVLGGVKIGDNINIDSTGHISVPVATESTVGLVKAGTGLAVSSDGTLTATGTYDLPEATKTTLGGVYMDDELSTSSTHPVQNAVVSLELQELSGDLTTLSGTVSGLNTTVGNLSTTVGNLSTTVGNLSTAVDNLDDEISTIEGNITLINGQIGDINDDITSLNDGFVLFQGEVAPYIVSDTIVVPSSDIDSNTWTDGNLSIYRRGKTGVATVFLQGSLTLADATPVSLFQITGDNIPAYESYGTLISDDGDILINILTSGYITIQNISGTSKTITKLFGSVPIVFE